MESINLKILPFVIVAVIFSFLTFNLATNLLSEVEIILDLTRVFYFLVALIIYVSITALSTAISLSQLKSRTYRLTFFGLLFLPYASSFILQNQLNTSIMLGILVLYVAMVFSIWTEFNQLYGNQIKTYIELPARACARTIIFFVALVVAVTFLAVNNNPENQKILGEKILTQITTSVDNTITQYNLISKMSGETSALSVPGAQLQRPSDSEMRKLITAQITSLITPYMDYIVYILSLLVFGTIAGASTFAGLSTALLGFIVIYILKSVGYLREVKQTVEVTRITL